MFDIEKEKEKSEYKICKQCNKIRKTTDMKTVEIIEKTLFISHAKIVLICINCINETNKTSGEKK